MIDDRCGDRPGPRRWEAEPTLTQGTHHFYVDILWLNLHTMKKASQLAHTSDTPLNSSGRKRRVLLPQPQGWYKQVKGGWTDRDIKIILRTLLSMPAIICNLWKLPWLLPCGLTLFVLSADTYVATATGWQITLHLISYPDPSCYMWSGTPSHWNGADPLIHTQTGRGGERDTRGDRKSRNIGKSVLFNQCMYL